MGKPLKSLIDKVNRKSELSSEKKTSDLDLINLKEDKQVYLKRVPEKVVVKERCSAYDYVFA